MPKSHSEEKFRRAALSVFKMYGVRKATMEEIAKAAGVSKPTLYAAFRNKDAALAGAIRFAKGMALEALRDAWQGVDDLETKLEIYLEHMVLDGFDMLHAAPDPEAFDTALGDASFAAIQDMRQMEADLIAACLAQVPALEAKGTTAEKQAAFFVDAANQAKQLMGSRDALMAFLRELKIVTLSLSE